ncbi:MAG: DinB family protein [Bacteroidia bacterium]
MKNHLLETWQIHNRINLYLLDAIAEEHLPDVSASKGRNVAEQFAHIHNVRLMWLKVADPSLMDGLDKLEKGPGLTQSALAAALDASGQAIYQLLDSALETGRLKGFKPHPSAFLGYMISHESHHRGQIMLCLKQSGHPVDKKTQFGLWEWGYGNYFTVTLIPSNGW